MKVYISCFAKREQWAPMSTYGVSTNWNISLSHLMDLAETLVNTYAGIHHNRKLQKLLICNGRNTD